MNILKYIKIYGNETLIEKRFHDVDNLIMTELSYINFHLLVKGENQEIRLGDITDEEINNPDVFVGSVDYKKNAKMLNLMRKSPRYKDIVVKEVVNKFSVEEENQFYAMTLFLPNNTFYIDFRGTDTTLTGWKEDFLLSVYEKIRAQIQANKYTNNIIEKYKGRFYIGGHSKGGNLAFYAALNMNPEHIDRFIGAFSFDGPGFKDGIKEFPNYEKVHGRLVKYLTYNNMIGSVFTDVEKARVVYSVGILGGHDPFGWRIRKKNGRFYQTTTVSTPSKAMNNKLMTWLDHLSMHQKMLFVEAFFRVFGESGTIYDLFRNFFRNLFNVRQALAIYNPDDRQALKDTFSTLFSVILKGEKKMRRAKIKKDEVVNDEGNDTEQN